MDDNTRQRWAQGLGLLFVLALTLVSYTGIGLGAGYLGVHKLHFPEWTVAVTGILGFIAGVYRVYLITRKMMDE